MPKQSTAWFHRVRNVEKAKVTFDFADLAVRVTWRDGFSVLVRSPTKDFMDYEAISAKMRRYRANHLMRKKRARGGNPVELDEAKLIEAYIASGKVTKCPTVYLDESTGREGNYIAPDTNADDERIRKKMSKNSKAGWRRRRQWKQAVHPE